MNAANKKLMIILEKKEAKFTEELQSLRNSASKKLVKQNIQKICEAKRRLVDGTFGFCEECFIAIPWRELCAKPEKSCCSNCEYNNPSNDGKTKMQQAG